jgi:outer membrane protein assembly factor BamB
MPAPKIKPPLPGDTTVVVTEHLPGAEILVFAGTEEVGHSGGNVINLSRPLANGETVKVMQRIGTCMSPFRYEIVVDCALGDNPRACSGDWPAFRHNGLRTARQTKASPLGDPYAVKRLQTIWSLGAPDGGSFTASPVVFNNRLYIGTDRGHLFAFDATTGGTPLGTPLWQFPLPGQPALTTQWATSGRCFNPSSMGIASSVAMAQIERKDVVILAAPDQGRPSDPGGRFGSGLGSGRLFALDAQNGNVIWATRDEVARMTGLMSGSTSELHEQIGYSSPLVLNGRIYVGVANHCDNPIQNGRVVAVDLNNGSIIPTFKYESTNDRGGGVWTFISGGLGDGIFTTTGNTRRGSLPEPSINNGLSMIRLNAGSGALEGKLQPVPFQLDNDPDWSAGTTLMSTSCGNLSVSTMKDGWAYAGNLGPPLAFRWQFPNVAYPFPGNDPNDHDDIRYHRAGAAWNDLYIGMVGGEDIVDRETEGETFAGYRRLHALNTCAGTGGRVAWIAELQPFTNEVLDTHGWGLGPTTVTNGIVYVGTNAGFLVAIADPSVWPSVGSRCTWSHLDGVACLDAGFQMVPKAAVLRSMNLGAGVITRNEPVITNGSLYVATSGGRLFRIAPK